MSYLLKTLENLKTIPSLSPLASVPDHSPPTIWWEVVRKRGDRLGMSRGRYGSYNIYEGGNRPKKSEGKMAKYKFVNEISLGLNFMNLMKLNEFYPLYFRHVLTKRNSIAQVVKAKNSMIEFNHNNNFNQGEVFYV